MIPDVCFRCKTVLVIGLNWFASVARKGSRLCGACHNAETQAYRKRNPARTAAIAKKHYDANREIILAKRDPEEERLKARRYREARPDIAIAQSATRRARKLNQTPTNADRRQIAATYGLAKTMKRATGCPYHVDHIIALSKGGPHHEANLVVMTAQLNQMKGSRDWPWLAWFAARNGDAS